ncbi:conserved Plasmodium protein, unknown function [Plasmodium sp. gorilla clade G2]|uniref:conserved Plasmodium protein, unknown function n=1 Tax=Plasmodium sp. gorilla clade G2 TaxID=880535 RepID=UPI000D222325|nr:conserved Plasmodium protein, unknown function [Plasmodium sp. gorilla clade G2]SOV10208.1 conserved Plasmodium protein, unknown function [Plasmodium sp. gorilla clade G2]
MKLWLVVCFLFLFSNNFIWAKQDDEVKKNKRYMLRKKFKNNKIHIMQNEPNKIFLQVQSKHIYDPTGVFRDMHNFALGASTIYFSRLMWGAIIFVIMFILVSIIGIYLYVDNLENTLSHKNKHHKNVMNHYIVNPNPMHN